MNENKWTKSPDDEEVIRYICHDSLDGTSCWARIRYEATVAHREGEKEVFVVCDRINRYKRNSDAKRFRYLSKKETADRIGSYPLDGIFMEMRFVSGDTIIYKESISSDNDILTLDGITDDLSKHEIFMILLEGRDKISESCLKFYGNKNISSRGALEVGMKIFAADPTVKDRISEKIKCETI
tara:strand:- start:210 stop:758 length:549 start_codon:yes stop_codon:yes gene_type:complete